MSWGERSCKLPCRNKNSSPSNCNVDCEFYEWDNKTNPDTISTKNRMVKKVESENVADSIDRRTHPNCTFLDGERHNHTKKMYIGRNERCPCGSGKKYKKCCGN